MNKLNGLQNEELGNAIMLAVNVEAAFKLMSFRVMDIPAFINEIDKLAEAYIRKQQEINSKMEVL